MIGLLGSGLFALASWRVNAFPRPASASPLVGSVVIVPMLAGMIGGLLPETVGQIMTLGAMATFGGGWIGMGIGAIRHDHRRLPQ